MNPVPPNIVAATRSRPPQEVFWLIKYGLRMTGMPAWDVRLSDEEMWTVTAFAEALPDVSPEAYARFLRDLGETSHDRASPQSQDPGRSAEVERGRIAVRMYGCHSCHKVPGIVGHDVEVGPPLDAMRRQAYIAGVLENTPANLAAWIVDPHDVDPLSAMPDLDVPRALARDIAAYLYDAGGGFPDATDDEEAHASQ